MSAAAVARAWIALACFPFLTAAAQEPQWQLPESDWGGATPLNGIQWYNINDYPDTAIRAGHEGYVTVVFGIDAQGRVSDCEVARSSGFATLDAVPCELLRKRARFAPAKDANGVPQVTNGTTSMGFWMPKGK